MPRGPRTSLLKPGDRAPHSAVYESVHRRHRAAHSVTVLQDEILPACNVCGEQVRYRLKEKGDHVVPAPRPPALLLVDPENTVSFTLKEVLQKCGYRVTTAGSYGKAAAMLHQRSFDVILTEVDLERGAEGLRLAIDAKQQRPAPIVILSAYKPTEEGLRAALGLANYLVFKPIDLKELQNALGTMVSRRAVRLAD